MFHHGPSYLCVPVRPIVLHLLDEEMELKQSVDPLVKTQGSLMLSVDRGGGGMRLTVSSIHGGASITRAGCTAASPAGRRRE